MRDKIMEIVYNKIKDINFYNYDNDEELNNVGVRLYTNLLQELVIDIELEHEIYTIHCFKSYADSEVNKND